MARDVQPIFILPENTQRTTGKNAQRNNILAAKVVADIVRTTLGPKGMDKMIVDSLGEIIITNDGVTILREMSIEHPAAKMLVEIAKTQEAEVGDGTTTAVVLAGELLKNAEALLDQNVHPTVISKGYRLAAEKAHVTLEAMAKPLGEDPLTLKKLAMTAITGKEAESSKEILSDLIVKAATTIMEKKKDGSKTTIIIDKNDIKIEKSTSGSIEESELIEGIVLDKEKLHQGMPNIVTDAKIALLDCPIEVKNTEIDAKIQITDPEKMQAFLDMEENMLRTMVNQIVSVGANVVLCQKGIDDLAQHFLAKKGIYACRRVSKSDMEKLARATGGNIVTDIKGLSAADLGSAGIVEQVKRDKDESMTYVKRCKNARSVTILVKGHTEHIVAEVVRAMEDAIGDVISALRGGKVVAGAGATEVELSKELRAYAESLSGREQLAVKAFADAMDVIPKTLAENAGLDPIDILVALKSAHDKKQIWAGIDVFSGKVIDAWHEGIIEPLKIKTQAVSSAAEVAIMILRIDDVIAGGKQPPMGGGAPGGMSMPEY